MTSTFVSVPGGRLHVADDGRPGDSPVLLLHAAIADLRSWDDIVPMLVAAGYRVVRYDLRGFGQTTTEEVDYSNRADAVAVLDALRIHRATLVGNSAGGQIAIDTAIESPDRVVAVVGVAAGLGGFETDATPEEVVAFERGDALEAADPPDVDAIVDFDLRFWVDGLGQPETRVRAAIRDKVRAMDAGQYAADRVSGRPMPLKPPAGARLADLRCPVLAVAGMLDASEVAQTARHLEEQAPNARAVVLPGVAHMIGMEVPGDLAALITEFLAPLPRWS